MFSDLPLRGSAVRGGERHPRHNGRVVGGELAQVFPPNVPSRAEGYHSVVVKEQ